MSLVAIDMKTCNKCKTSKPITEFRKHKETKDKLTTYCKHCLQEQVKGWVKNNKERLNAWNTNYREKNKKQINANQKKWRETNKGKKNADTALRFSAKMQRTPRWLTKEQKQSIKQFYVMAAELEKVFPWTQCVDHIVPLRGKDVCGLHVPWNLQILSAKDNMEKGNRYNG
jgi:thiaminase